jgi:hypothetical protein
MKTKTVKILLEDYGSYLGIQKGCFMVKKNRTNKKVSLCVRKRN